MVLVHYAQNWFNSLGTMFYVVAKPRIIESLYISNLTKVAENFLASGGDLNYEENNTSEIVSLRMY